MALSVCRRASAVRLFVTLTVFLFEFAKLLPTSAVNASRNQQQPTERHSSRHPRSANNSEPHPDDRHRHIFTHSLHTSHKHAVAHSLRATVKFESAARRRRRLRPRAHFSHTSHVASPLHLTQHERIHSGQLGRVRQRKQSAPIQTSMVTHVGHGQLRHQSRIFFVAFLSSDFLFWFDFSQARPVGSCQCTVWSRMALSRLWNRSRLISTATSAAVS